MNPDETRPDRDTLREQVWSAIYDVLVDHPYHCQNECCGFSPEREARFGSLTEDVEGAVVVVVEPALAQRDAEIERLRVTIRNTPCYPLGGCLRSAHAEILAERDEARAALAQRDAERRAERDAVRADLVAILAALGIGDHARPYSAHDVVQREILPTIAALRDSHADGCSQAMSRAEDDADNLADARRRLAAVRDEAASLAGMVAAHAEAHVEMYRDGPVANNLRWVASRLAALAGDQP